MSDFSAATFVDITGKLGLIRIYECEQVVSLLDQDGSSSQ